MRKQKVLEALLRLAPFGAPRGVTAEEVAQVAGIHRHNASADLNELHREGLVTKSSGRPVRFAAVAEAMKAAFSAMPEPVRPSAPEPAGDPFAALVGAQSSLRAAIEQAKAAMLYPPRGLPTLIAGPTGAGKSRLAEAMYHYAVASGRLRPGAPFCVFNCADYAANPQLLLAQLFGHVRGAFTGADRDVLGLIADAEGGLIFLDEIHRLPPEGQEMLFLLMDRGIYRALGAGSTQKASVTLVGATSEDPRSSLLHTFVRRFPVVINLPDLDARPLEERLTLVELFLQEEAYRVGISVSVSPLALAALLSFRASGNVGELRSAVLLGCAKAFLHYMAADRESGVMTLYLTHLSPQIQLAYLSAAETVREAEQLVGVEDRLYMPDAAGRPRDIHRDDYIPPDLYRELHRRVTGYLDSGLQPRELQRLIQTDLDHYLQRLLRRADGPGRVPKGLLDVVAGFVSQAGAELGRTFGQEVVTSLALHLASGARVDKPDADQTLALVSHCPAEYGVVRRLAGALEAKLGMAIGAAEMGFLALFLAAHGRKATPSGLSVMVIAHGERTASSMADVANRLLETDRVVAVDMPLEQSVEKTMQIAADRLKQVGRTDGVVLLVDMGSLTGFGPALQQAVGVPVVVIPLVTTPAVIEAARVAGEPGADLHEVLRAVRAVYQPQPEEPAQLDGKRMIITTCLTGHGTARKLAAFLAEALPAAVRKSVTVEAIDLEKGSVLPGLLVEGWRGTVIAAAGTVDPRLPGVPFIGMEQILFGDGLQYVEALALGQQHEPPGENHVSRTEAAALASQFAAGNIMSLDGQKAAEAAVVSLQRLEAAMNQQLTPGQTARWIIHFAFALERLITDGTAYPCSEQDYLAEQNGALLEQIREAVAPVEASWEIVFPPGEIAFLALIVLTM
ncbi:MAG TPA: sigma 54-interacting transcriptional regulator [Symbiobacteriaceae bacterium]|nr:sigma 54-interacting transcriptional regulator [Symbiobacteriaceae bacterium]